MLSSLKWKKYVNKDIICDTLPVNPLPTIFLSFTFYQHKDAQLGFTPSNIAMCSVDLLTAGTDTTSTSLLWMLVYLIKYPHVQGVRDVKTYNIATHVFISFVGSLIHHFFKYYHQKRFRPRSTE